MKDSYWGMKLMWKWRWEREWDELESWVLLFVHPFLTYVQQGTCVWLVAVRREEVYGWQDPSSAHYMQVTLAGHPNSTVTPASADRHHEVHPSKTLLLLKVTSTSQWPFQGLLLLNLNDLTDDLTVEEERILAEECIVIGQSVAGKRKISAAFLSPRSSPPSVSSSSTFSTASVSIQSVSKVNATLDVPEHLESQATVEICGFTREAAHEIHARWASRPDPQNNPDDI
ncbi:MAG: hypothetical protein Q9173_003884 [Seirophora scorigena]